MRRQFLFVGGPFGPFFRQVARRLKRAGATVLHVNLHGGDWLDWGIRDSVHYRGRPADWEAWLADLMDRHQFTDVVTYGDCGVYSGVLLDLAKERKLVRHVYELGYVRPHCITLDRNGVNGYSSLPRSAVDYRLAPEPPAAKPKPFGRMMPFHVGYTIAHCLAHYAAKPYFHRYDAGWPSSPLRQALGYLTRVAMDRLTWRRQRQAERDVVWGKAPFFLCALQKSGDTQINEHSDFGYVVRFIDYVAESFAKHAPPDAKLVFKAHPLDYGIEPQETAVALAAKLHRIEGRLVFLPTGSLTDLMRATRGMVTVNSTAGLTAVIKGVPTFLAGNAFYEIDGLVNTYNLDRFWSNPRRPDWSLAERFLAVAAAKTQINGSYYAPAGRNMAVPEAARRMLARSPADPEHLIDRRAERERDSEGKVSHATASGTNAPGARPRLA